MAKKTVITQVQDVEVNESIIEFPQNKSLMVEKLTNDDATKPEIVHGLQSMDDVFNHYKPNVKVEFEDGEGASKKEELKFNNLGDFGTKGITAQSEFLKDLETQKETYLNIVKQLKGNAQLRKAISESESKEALLDAMKALLKELD